MRRFSLHLACATALAAAFCGHAAAQEIQAPRYEALEQQLQMLEQRQLDTLESQRMKDIITPPTQNSTSAQRALRQLDIERQQREFILRGEQERMQMQRERALSEATLPNRRVAPSSILVVNEPAQYGLPRLPDGKYYARLQGRFVVVDAASEMVEHIVPVRSTDPTADVPQGARPPLLPPIPVTEP